MKLFSQYAVNAVVAIIFGALLYFGITQFLAKHWLVAFISVTIALMCIPFVDHNHSIHDRIEASLMMAFPLGGMVVFVAFYFLLFYFEAFQAVFNDKGSGPAGLVLFALTGAGVGGYVGFRIVRSISSRIRLREQTKSDSISDTTVSGR